MRIITGVPDKRLILTKEKGLLTPGEATVVGDSVCDAGQVPGRLTGTYQERRKSFEIIPKGGIKGWIGEYGTGRHLAAQALR